MLNAMKFNFLRREGIRVVMFGQTMGPYHSFRIPVMRNLLGKVDKIYPRDEITYQYLVNLGLKNIYATDDLALLPLAKQEIRERLKQFITYCPSELIYRYAKEGTREDWMEFNLFMVNKIMNKYTDKKLVLLAHVLKPEHVDDRIIVNELYELLKDEYKERLIVKRDELYPYEVRNIIQESLFVVSSRMHPVISSIQCAVPAIALSYSSKYWGIIGERYGLGEYILDVRYMDYIEMKEKFVDLINKIEMDYELLKENMINMNKLTSNRIISALHSISDL
jgi:colanic acid/amylovoran biosynthesis protein